jgi:adenylate cyclase
VDGGAVKFRLVDTVAVKGKQQAVRVYELLEGERTETVVAYERALAAYLARDFAGARDILLGLGDDPPSRVMAARCAVMLADPPPADWNGVYVAKAK